VLSGMEDGGRLRRGYFVEGLAGAQFARPGVVDRLRVASMEGEGQGAEISVLAAVDPASPWGGLLPWPDAGRQHAVRARRVPGAWVILVEGAPVLYLAANRYQLVTFPETTRDDAALIMAIAALADFPQRLRRGSLTIVKVDGEPVTESPLLRPMLECGFVRDYRGLVIERDYRRAASSRE